MSPSTSSASGFSVEQHLLGADQNAAEHRPEAGGVDAHVVVGRPQTQVVEEDLVERVVVVLTGVHQHVLDARGLVEPVDHAGQPDDLGARADDGHDLHASASWAIVSGYWSGLAGSSSWSAQNIVTRSSSPTLRMLCTHRVGMSTNDGLARR